MIQIVIVGDGQGGEKGKGEGHDTVNKANRVRIFPLSMFSGTMAEVNYLRIYRRPF